MLSYGCYIWIPGTLQSKSFRKTGHLFAANNTLERQSIYSYLLLSHIIMPIRIFLKRQFSYFAFFIAEKRDKTHFFCVIEQNGNIIPYRVQIRLGPLKYTLTDAKRFSSKRAGTFCRRKIAERNRAERRRKDLCIQNHAVSVRSRCAAGVGRTRSASRRSGQRDTVPNCFSRPEHIVTWSYMPF